jgi:hypothetical protein
MARLVEMGKLEALCMKRADLEGDDHIDHAEWLELISEAYGELFGIVADSGMRYFEASATLVTDGTNVLKEPADILAVMGLWHVESSGCRHIVTPLQAHEMTRWAGRTGGRAERYEQIDDEFRLYAKPPAGQNYELRFIPQAPDLSSFASDACVDCVCAEGQAFVVWNTAVKALSKSESGTQLAMVERDRMAEKLRDWAVYRAMIDPRPRYVAENDHHFVSPASWRHR